jgi:hypothetical protein
MALRSVSDSLFGDFDRWSATSSEYDGTEATARKWKSFDGDGITVASLIKMAQEDSPGWKPPANSKPPRGDAKPKVPPILATRPYSEITMLPVNWLWNQRIAYGKLTLVAGVPGVGKTFLVTDLAARCSIGAAFPDGAAGHPCESLIMTAEDGPSDTILPRLVAHGADVSKVHHMDFVKQGDAEIYWTMTMYLDTLEAWLDSHPAVKLVVLDPITAFMGDVDSHKNAEVRGALGPLIRCVERRGVALLGLTHLSKAQAKSVNRVIGSIAFIAAARAAWLVEWDPEADGRRLFVQIKNNLAHADGLAYSIADGRIQWAAGTIKTTADDLSDPGHTTARDAAEQWLRSALEQGRVASNKIASAAERDGISSRTLNRAKRVLRVQSVRDGSSWFWFLPDGQDGALVDGTDRRQKYDFGEYGA